MDEKKARRLLDEKLRKDGQRRVGNEEWHLLCQNSYIEELADDFNRTAEEDVALAAVNLIVFLRRATASKKPWRPRGSVTQHSEPLSAPRWWAQESQRRLTVLAAERVWMRVDAGLFPTPKHKVVTTNYRYLFDRGIAPEDALAGREPYLPLASVAEIAPLVRRLIKEQVARFYALYEDKEPEWGWDPEDFQEYELEIEFPAATWEQDRRTERTFFLPAGFAAVGEQPPSLDALYRRSISVAQALGISQAECLVWGLTNSPFTIPWIATTAHSGWWYDWSNMTVQVNSLSATALAVGQAFAQSRPSPSKAEGRRERAPGPWPAIASAFVEQRRKERKERQGPPAETWDELYVAFTAAYDAHYVSMRSFREACYRYEKERESLRSVTTGETDEEDS